MAELTLSHSTRLHMVPPFADVVAHLFLCVSALSVKDNEYVGPSKVFLLDSEMSSTDPERNKIQNIHV